MKKRITSFIFALLIAFSAIGCQPEPLEPVDTTAPETLPPKPAQVVLKESGIPGYTVIRPERAEDAIIKQATSLRKGLLELYGGERTDIGFSDDWVKNKEDIVNDDPEILVGLTNRPESIAAASCAGYLDYSVTVTENKIAVFAHTAERLAEAVEHVLKNTALEDGKLIYRGGDIVSVYDYPIKDLTFCGLPAKDFVIVIPEKASDSVEALAQSIREYIATESGALLEIVADSESQAEAEILIGDVDRAEVKNIKKEGYKLMAEGKKVILSAGSSAYFYAAKDLMLDKIKEEGKLEEGLKIEVVDSAMDFFLADNYASGLVKDELNLAVQAMFSCLEYFNDRMVYGSKNLGERWVYSNRGANAKQTGYFDDMLVSDKKGGNCASPVNWALCEMGIVPANDRFYGGSTGNFASYSGDAREYLAPYCEIIDMYDDPVPFNELFRAGKVKAGDIFLCKHHTFVYRGDRSFYAAGHDGAWHTEADAPTEDERKAVFDNWVLAFDEVAETGNKVAGKYNTNYTYKVYYIVRLKDDVIPAAYRNKEGKLVKNPMVEE